MTSTSCLGSIRFDLFRESDITSFLDHAIAEEWICDRWEFEFLLRTSPRSCIVARCGTVPVAFATSIAYGRSGWIGNLLVRREFRSVGLGSRLMELALKALAAEGTETVWLTASEAGRPIYEKLGFVSVDTVKRWVGTGADGMCMLPLSPSLAEIEAMDTDGWGDRRTSLLQVTAGRGMAVGGKDGFLVSQPCGTGRQIGPWSCSDQSAAELLLADARFRAGEGFRMFLDSPARNQAAAELLTAHNFSILGSTLLMRRGPDQGYRPEQVFALASMGSMG